MYVCVSFNMVKDISGFEVYGPQIAQFVLALLLLSLAVYYDKIVPWRRGTSAPAVEYKVEKQVGFLRKILF